MQRRERKWATTLIHVCRWDTLQNADPGDWPRFKALEVSAIFTPWWLGVDVPDPAEKGRDQS